MPIGKKWSRLEKATKSAPTDNGVYEFGISGRGEPEIIYIGKGEGDRGVRARVIAHINGSKAGNSCIDRMLAKHKSRIVVRWEECSFWNSASEKEKNHFIACHFPRNF